MTTNKVTTPYDDLTYRIIGCAMASHRNLGPGHRENIYQRDITVRLTESGISYEPQKLYEVHDSIDGLRVWKT